MAFTDGMADMCCTCVNCFREEGDGRSVYRCSAENGGMVAMKRRACSRFRRANPAEVSERILHGQNAYIVGCRCDRCVKAHAVEMAHNRMRNKAERCARRKARRRDGDV